ncbi:unnamed protein product [marine sediment metagenome]|uniref:Uncharacterized protein n=1 Tax=marine sediment metagenome TaxID=412755 RepID=X1TF25_9ZZZZ
MITLEINQIFDLLIDSVLNKSSKELKNYCKNIGMTYKKPVPDVGQYSQLPPFDDRVCYEFNSPKANFVIFEFLIYSDKILQTGVNLYYNNTGLFSNYGNRAFELIKGFLDDYFGRNDEIKMFIYYDDHNLLGYVSYTLYIDQAVVNLKIGNAKIINEYFQISYQIRMRFK